MRTRYRSLKVLVHLWAVAPLVSCGDSGATLPTEPTPAEPTPEAVATVEISAPASAVFEDGSLTLTVRTLSAAGSVLTGRSVAWSTSDAAVATVDGVGIVSAHDPGTVMITATSEGKTGDVTLTVLRSNVVELRLSAASAFIGTGDTLTITAQAIDSAGRVLRNRLIAWESNDQAVVSVADGLLTGVAEGLASVTASTEGLEVTTDVDVYTTRGIQVATLVGIDAALVGYMRANDIPGATLAVVRDGRLAYARAYGMANVAAGEAMEPDRLLRYGSLSKPITGIAVWKLIEAGALALDELPFAAMSHLPVLPGETEDPRVVTVTLGDLLDHAGGWDNARAVDAEVWRGRWQDGLSDPAQLFRYGRGVPLDHDPGTTYAYSNYSAQAAALYLEFVTGVDYETWVRANIFLPLGITRPFLGTSDPASWDPDESVYYDPDGNPITVDHGGMDYWWASGSWVGSAVDLVRLINGVEGLNGPALLQPSTVEQMLERNTATFPGTGYYYTNFWGVTPEAGGLTWEHSGLPTGGFGQLRRHADGTTWALLLNRSPPRAYPDLQPAMAAVAAWPAHDLFSSY